MNPVLETPRLRLRPLAAADAPRIAALCADLEVARWLARMPHPYTLADAEEYVAAAGDGLRAIEPRAGGGLVGVVGIEGPAEAGHLGYWLGRAFWGRGWMTEAVRAAVACAFLSGAGMLASGAFEGNDRSLAIQRRLGFRETGRRDLHCRALGATRRHVDTTLVRPDWEAAA